MDNFDLRKYLVENKLTVNTRRSSIFERFLNGETEYKTLKELMTSLKEATADTVAQAKETIEDLTPQEQAALLPFAVNTAGEIQSSDDITRDTFSQKFMTWSLPNGKILSVKILTITTSLVFNLTPQYQH